MGLFYCMSGLSWAVMAQARATGTYENMRGLVVPTFFWQISNPILMRASDYAQHLRLVPTKIFGIPASMYSKFRPALGYSQLKFYF